jgi:hypothetical protein
VSAGVLGSAVVLVAAAYLTRAGARRLAGAMAGGAAAAALNVAIDVAASAARLWWYPGVATAHAPLWYYAGALLGVAAIALGLWRLARRFGPAGTAAGLGAAALLFPIRDYRVAATSGAIEFGGGAAPWLADGLAAFLVVALAAAVMRFVAGPARSDALARG